jgi:hypothetical protein
VPRRELPRAEPEAVRGARREILHHHVGGRDQLVEDSPAGRVLEVDP